MGQIAHRLDELEALSTQPWRAADLNRPVVGRRDRNLRGKVGLVLLVLLALHVITQLIT